MHMHTDFLAGLSCTKYSNHWHLWPEIILCGSIPKGQRRIQFRGRRLIVVDAVETNAKGLH